MKPWQVAALALLLVVALESDAEAYLDPGTGSFIFQTVIATVVGSAFVLKTFWRRVKTKFSRRSAAPLDEKSDEVEQAHGHRS